MPVTEVEAAAVSFLLALGAYSIIPALTVSKDSKGLSPAEVEQITIKHCTKNGEDILSFGKQDNMVNG